MQDTLGIKKELERKLIHLSTSIIPIMYFFINADREQIIFLCVFISIGFLAVDLLRFLSGFAEKHFLRIFSKLLRTAEYKTDLTGATYLFIGLSISVILFPREVAIPAMLFLTIADPFAAVAGKTMGLKRIFNKSLGGFIAFFMTASLISLVFTSLGLLGVVIAFLTAIVEIVPIKINDNLSIPIFSGYLIYLLR